MPGEVTYGIGLIAGILALMLFFLFEPRDPSSRRETTGIVRRKWHLPENIVYSPVGGRPRIDPILVYRYCPEGWWVAVEADGQMWESEISLRAYEKVAAGAEVRVIYSKTRFTRRGLLEEIRLP